MLDPTWNQVLEPSCCLQVAVSRELGSGVRAGLNLGVPMWDVGIVTTLPNSCPCASVPALGLSQVTLL